MPTMRKTLQILSILPLFGLAACGDEWEMVPYEGVPYTMERTAGRGVEYVLAKLAPKKGIVETTTTVVEPPPAAPPPPAAEPAPAPIEDAAPVFNEQMAK